TRTDLIFSDLKYIADHPGVRVVSGDFNGDHQTDFAMLPTPTASTGGNAIVVAVQEVPPLAPGILHINQATGPNATFLSWAATAGVTPVPGDFNADGRTDIALLGGAGWTRIPIAFANNTTGQFGLGFTVTDMPVANFPRLGVRLGREGRRRRLHRRRPDGP